MSMKDFVNTLTSEQKQALLDALSDTNSTVNQFVPQETNEEVKKEISENFIVQSKQTSLQNNRRRETVRARENTWQDIGEDRNIETPAVARTPRTRKPANNKVEATCHICGKTVKIDKRFQYGEFYRCDRCGTKR